MGCFCSSSAPADFDGKKDYSNEKYSDIIDAISNDKNDNLKDHFRNGWRTHHILKDDKNNRRYIHLIQEKNKFSYLIDIPITFDVEVLLTKGTEEKKLYEHLLSNLVVLKNIHSSITNEENVNIKAKYVLENEEVYNFISKNKPTAAEKEGEENYSMYKYLMENVFKKPAVTETPKPQSNPAQEEIVSAPPKNPPENPPENPPQNASDNPSEIKPKENVEDIKTDPVINEAAKDGAKLEDIKPEPAKTDELK